CRNLSARELWTGFDAGIQLPDFVERHFRDFSLAVSPALDVTVMAQNQLSVGSCADIDLYELGTQTNGLLEGRHRVFGVVQVLAPMSDGYDASGLPLSRQRQQ